MLFYFILLLVYVKSDFEVDGFTYHIIHLGADNVQVVNCSISSDLLRIPSIVSYNSINYSVISISSGAFSSVNVNQYKLVYLPYTLLATENGIFSWFRYLESICYIDENDELVNDTLPPKFLKIRSNLFWHCEMLKKIDVNNVIELGPHCFGYCFSLTNITLRKVEVIGEFSFQLAKLSSTIELPKTLREIQANAFVESSIVNVTGELPKLEVLTTAFNECHELSYIPKLTGIIRLNDFAFAGCYKLREVYCGPNLEYIGYSCFNGCNLLESFTTESKSYNISTRAFCVCSSLSTFNFEGVNEIKENAFEACYSFIEVDMSKSNLEEVLPIFQDCPNLTSIILPRNLAVFDLNSFEGTDLQSLTFSGTKGTLDLKAVFFECKLNLSEVIFDSSCNVNLDSAFASCYHLSRVVLPKTPYQLHYTFAHCFNLTEVENLEYCTLLDYTFFSCISLTRIDSFPALKTIGKQTFMNCKSLESIPSLQSVEVIGSRCFLNCFSLKKFECGSQLKSVGLEAFFECVLLEDFITSSPNYIVGIEAFQYCFALKSFDFSVCSEIQYGAFDHCTSLFEIDLSKSKFASLSFNTFADCSSLHDIIFQPNLESIDSKCFFNCANITSLHFPSLKCINSSAFECCTGLKTVTFENQPLLISYHAFYSCTSLQSIELLQSDSNLVATIENGAFENCTALKSFKFDKWSISSIGEYAFHGCPLSHKLKFKGGSSPTNLTIFGHAFSSSLIQSIDLRFDFSSLFLNDQSFVECKDIKCVMVNDNHKDDVVHFFNEKIINGRHCPNYFKTHIVVLVVIILAVLLAIILIIIFIVCVIKRKNQKKLYLSQPLVTSQQPIYTINNDPVIEEEEEDKGER